MGERKLFSYSYSADDSWAEEIECRSFERADLDMNLLFLTGNSLQSDKSITAVRTLLLRPETCDAGS